MPDGLQSAAVSKSILSVHAHGVVHHITRAASARIFPSQNTTTNQISDVTQGRIRRNLAIAAHLRMVRWPSNSSSRRLSTLTCRSFMGVPAWHCQTRALARSGVTRQRDALFHPAPVVAPIVRGYPDACFASHREDERAPRPIDEVARYPRAKPAEVLGRCRETSRRMPGQGRLFRLPVSLDLDPDPWHKSPSNRVTV